jgi:hypothetical protein
MRVGADHCVTVSLGRASKTGRHSGRVALGGRKPQDNLPRPLRFRKP